MRAINVMRFLRKEGLIPAERITVTGFSQVRPFLTNKTDAERKRNRRVEIIIPTVEEFF